MGFVALKFMSRECGVAEWLEFSSAYATISDCAHRSLSLIVAATAIAIRPMKVMIYAVIMTAPHESRIY
jgi:hypothetical protein